ncbi:MAG: L-threonylcarbamoyladenylate synthase [Candidatus Margulisiibacteriota bacterium]
MWASALKAGQIGILGTDTVWGLSGLATAENAQRIAKLKHRDPSSPFILLIADQAMATHYALFDAVYKETLANDLWPGPITLILPKKDLLSGAVPGPTVALRCPNYPQLRALIAEVGYPLFSTSLNLSGQPTPTSLAEVPEALKTGVDFMATDLPPLGGAASTVLDCAGDTPQIRRKGAGLDAVLDHPLCRHCL